MYPLPDGMGDFFLKARTNVAGLPDSGVKRGDMYKVADGMGDFYVKIKG